MVSCLNRCPLRGHPPRCFQALALLPLRTVEVNRRELYNVQAPYLLPYLNDPMNDLRREKSKISDKLQTKRSFGDAIGLWRLKSEVKRPSCDKCKDRVGPVYRGQRPLQVSDIHRVIDIVPQMVEDYEDPLWLVRRIAEEQLSDSAASQTCQLSRTRAGDAASERRRTASLDTKNVPRDDEIEGTKTLFPHVERHDNNRIASGKDHKRFLTFPVAPLRLRRNQNRPNSVATRDVGGSHIRDDRSAYAQSLSRRSNALPLDDALSPLQRMTNRLNEWTTGMTADDGARLRPGPAAHLPIVRQAKLSTATIDSPQKSAKPPARTCPPFPSISHSNFDLRCASQKPGCTRARVHSSPSFYEFGRWRMLPICQKDSRTDSNKAAVGRR